MDYEESRLAAVARFKHLNVTIRKDLNDLINLVAKICDVPVAMVALLDKDTQWFKAFSETEAPFAANEVCFCKQIIKQDSLFIIPDMALYKSTCVCDCILGEQNIRFCAGLRLSTKDGFHIGAICVLDSKPRVLNEHQVSSLTLLSKQAMNLMELNWSLSIQNEALTRIATIQSHELRRPVASLLGLMEVMKIEHIDFDYFDMMELTVNDIDAKIRTIVKDSEDTIQKPQLAIVA